MTLPPLATTNPFHGDEDDAMTTDPSLPVIVVESKPGFDKLIDENHRLFKALALRHSTVRAAGGIVQDWKVTPPGFFVWERNVTYHCAACRIFLAPEPEED